MREVVHIFPSRNEGSLVLPMESNIDLDHADRGTEACNNLIARVSTCHQRSGTNENVTGQGCGRGVCCVTICTTFLVHKVAHATIMRG